MEISDILKKLRIPACFRGYHYLHTAIIMCIKDNEYLELLTKRLYPDVGKIYKKTGKSIERASKYALEIAFDKKGLDGLKEVFDGKVYFEQVPSSSEFIKLITKLYISNN